jgi:hypothetical protein
VNNSRRSNVLAAKPIPVARLPGRRPEALAKSPQPAFNEPSLPSDDKHSFAGAFSKKCCAPFFSRLPP